MLRRQATRVSPRGKECATVRSFRGGDTVAIESAMAGDHECENEGVRTPSPECRVVW